LKPRSRRKPIPQTDVFPPLRLYGEDIEAIIDIFTRHEIEVTLDINDEYEVNNKEGVGDVHKMYINGMIFRSRKHEIYLRITEYSNLIELCENASESSKSAYVALLDFLRMKKKRFHLLFTRWFGVFLMFMPSSIIRYYSIYLFRGEALIYHITMIIFGSLLGLFGMLVDIFRGKPKITFLNKTILLLRVLRLDLS
jgi:hypothetical protein